MFARCFLLVMLLAPSAWAIRGATPTEVVQTAVGIVDATVTGFDADGHARLEIHSHWMGTVEPEVRIGRHGCWLTMPDQFLKPGQRYILIIGAEGVVTEHVSHSPVMGEQVQIDGEPSFPKTMSAKAFKKALLAMRTAVTR
jgi:hypothetical protein